MATEGPVESTTVSPTGMRSLVWTTWSLFGGRVFLIPVTVVGMGRRLLARRRDALDS